MRRGQGLPVNMIVLIALALLVLVVVGAFFISGFSQASGSVNIVEADQAACNGKCQTLTAAALSLRSCGAVAVLSAYTNTGGTGFSDINCQTQYGPCEVTLRGGARCICEDDNNCGAQDCDANLVSGECPAGSTCCPSGQTCDLTLGFCK